MIESVGHVAAGGRTLDDLRVEFAELPEQVVDFGNSGGDPLIRSAALVLCGGGGVLQPGRDVSGRRHSELRGGFILRRRTVSLQ